MNHDNGGDPMTPQQEPKHPCCDVVPSAVDMSTPGIIRATFGGERVELREIVPTNGPPVPVRPAHMKLQAVLNAPEQRREKQRQAIRSKQRHKGRSPKNRNRP